MKFPIFVLMSSLDQMHLLVNLARVDGEVGEKEKQYIINIGQANHMMVAEILPLFSEEHEMFVPSGMTEDEKFDCIFQLVKLMKIDQRLYHNEIRYVAEVASRLGYDREALFELMLNVRSADMSKGEVEAVRELTLKHLKRI